MPYTSFQNKYLTLNQHSYKTGHRKKSHPISSDVCNNLNEESACRKFSKSILSILSLCLHFTATDYISFEAYINYDFIKCLSNFSLPYTIGNTGK